MSVDRNSALFLSDGTPVSFVKVTSRGRFQVRIPASHPLGAADPLRIFDPTTGAHYKRATDLTLTNTAPVSAAPASAPVAGRVDPNAPLYLSDGTAVEFVKETRRGNIQVRLPDSHADAAGQENGLLYDKATGARYKGRHSLFLTNTAPASASSDSAPAMDVVAATNDTFALSVGDSIIDDGYDSFDAAEAAAIDSLGADCRSVTIVKMSTTVVGVVGITSTRS